MPYFKPERLPQRLSLQAKSASSAISSFSSNPPIASKSCLRHQKMPTEIAPYLMAIGRRRLSAETAMPRLIRSNLPLEPPPTYRPVDRRRCTSSSRFVVIRLSASMVTRVSPLAAAAPLLRICDRFLRSSLTMTQPRERAIASVPSVQRFRTTITSVLLPTLLAAA
ncbi:hypothetical protein D3C75_709000 [compost metagenome]